MVAIILNLALLTTIVFSFKKKRFAIAGVLCGILTFNTVCFYLVNKNPMNFYNIIPGEYIFAKCENIEVGETTGDISSVLLEDGVKIDLTSKNNAFSLSQQYHSDDIEAHIIETKQVLTNKLLYYLSGVPKEKDGYFIELMIPSEL